MAKRKATVRRRPTAAAKRAAAPKRRASARKATARKATRKVAKPTRPAAKRKAKKSARKAAPKAGAVRLIRRVTKKTAAAPKRKAVARTPAKKLIKKAVPKAAAPKVVARKRVASPAPAPAPAPVRAVAAKPKAIPAAGGKKKHALGLDRERRVIRDDDIVSPTPPSSLSLDRSASAARTGRQELKERYDKHNETSPALTGGDVDADWESAYSVGDEAPGGDNPTPDQNNVDDIGVALGVEYEDNEELEGADKIEERDKHRWEDDPASSEDFDDR